MKVYTGERKTPEGYYLVIVEGECYERKKVKFFLSKIKNIKVDEIDRKIIIYTRSRRNKNEIYKKLVMMKTSFSEVKKANEEAPTV